MVSEVCRERVRRPGAASNSPVTLQARLRHTFPYLKRGVSAESHVRRAALRMFSGSSRLVNWYLPTAELILLSGVLRWSTPSAEIRQRASRYARLRAPVPLLPASCTWQCSPGMISPGGMRRPRAA